MQTNQRVTKEDWIAAYSNISAHAHWGPSLKSVLRPTKLKRRGVRTEFHGPKMVGPQLEHWSWVNRGILISAVDTGGNPMCGALCPWSQYVFVVQYRAILPFLTQYLLPPREHPTFPWTIWLFQQVNLWRLPCVESHLKSRRPGTHLRPSAYLPQRPIAIVSGVGDWDPPLWRLQMLLSSVQNSHDMACHLTKTASGWLYILDLG